MKLATPRESFLQHLQLVAPLSPLRTPRPIQKDVLVEGEGQQVRLTATDGDVTMRTSYEVEGVSAEGRAALPAATLLSAVRSLTAEDLSIEEKGTWHQLVGGSSSFRLNGDDPSNYPLLPTVETDVSVVVPLRRFLDACGRTMFAAAREMGRYAFNGVMLEMEGQQIVLVATDGRRLALSRLQMDKPVQQRVSGILPLKGLTQLHRAAGDSQESSLRIDLHENQVAFRLDRTEIVAQLVEGEFPDYRAVLPKEEDAPKRVVIPRADFTDAIKRAAVTAGEEVRAVELTFDQGTLTVSSRHEGVGESRSEVPVEYTGDMVSLRFNPDFLGEYLKTVPDETVTFRFRDHTSAGYMITEDESIYVLMPITS